MVKTTDTKYSTAFDIPRAVKSITSFSHNH